MSLHRAVQGQDFTRLAAAAHRVTAGIQAQRDALTEMTARMVEITGQHLDAQNNPVCVAGLEGTYTVRAGLDPRYADPVARDLLITSILRGNTDTMCLTRRNRSIVAAAAMRGWCLRHD